MGGGETSPPLKNPPVSLRPVPTVAAWQGHRVSPARRSKTSVPGKGRGDGACVESVWKANKGKRDGKLRRAGPCRAVYELSTTRRGFGSSCRGNSAKERVVWSFKGHRQICEGLSRVLL